MAYNDEKGGRPPKEGLDYFPLQTRLDSKFGLVQAAVRRDYEDADDTFLYAFAARDIILRMYQRIYDEKGYYFPWDDNHKLLWINDESAGFKFTEYVINLAIKWEIFNQEKYDKYQILTSKGLQDRYIMGTRSRTETIIYKEFSLTDKVKRDKVVIKSAHDTNNQQEVAFAVEDAENVKPKEVDKKEPTRTKMREITEELVDLWNDQNGTRLRLLDSRVKQVERRLKEYTPKELKQAVIYRAADVWIAENNQQSNWDALFRNDKGVDEWLNRPPKNGHAKEFDPAKDADWMLRDAAIKHADDNRKELKSTFYEVTEHKGTKYFKAKF